MNQDHDEFVDERRDLELGAALAALPHPKLSDDMDARLRAALEVERRRLRRRRSVTTIALAAALAALAFGAAAFAGVFNTDTATAADMLIAMDGAASGAQTLRLDVVGEYRSVFSPTADSAGQGLSESANIDRTVTELTLSASGDTASVETRRTLSREGAQPWTRGAPATWTSSYDESRHERRDQGAFFFGSQAPFTVRRPSWPSGSLDYEALAQCLRAQLAAADPNTPVAETTYLGRPAWSADLVERQPVAGGSDFIIRWAVTVDKATGLLLAAKYASTEEAEPFTVEAAYSVRVTRLDVDPQLPEGWQLAPLPAEGPVPVIDGGTRFGTAEEVAQRSWPTLPLLPQSVPAGYALGDLASASFVGPGDYVPWWYVGHSTVVGRQGRFIMERLDQTLPGQIVRARFRRGFDTFDIEIAPKALEKELVDTTPAPPDRPGAETVTLTGGYLDGAQATLWVTPYEGHGPTLLTHSDRSMITITGDLTRQELIDVANSLRAYGDVAKPLPEGYGE